MERYQGGGFADTDTDDGVGRSHVFQDSSRAASIKSARTDDSRSTHGSITRRERDERIHGLKYPFSRYKPTTSNGGTSRVSAKSRTGSLLRTSAATQYLEVEDDNRDEDDLESDIRGGSTAGTSVRFEEAPTSPSTKSREHGKRRRRRRPRTDQDDETSVGQSSRRRAHRSREEVTSSAVSSNPRAEVRVTILDVANRPNGPKTPRGVRGGDVVRVNPVPYSSGSATVERVNSG